MQARQRREVLINKMSELAGSEKNCASCSGLCCTSLKNSMQTSQQETLDIYEHLKSSGQINKELIATLTHCIGEYRLDKFFGDGRRALRKTYTCPFYSQGPTGCSIPKHVKPYGCLAFNPTRVKVTDGIGCESDQELLIQREESSRADLKVNEKLWWDKLPMPVALLEVIKLYGDQV